MRDILIIPCSAAKAEHPCKAFDLYQGKGYMSVIRKYDEAKLKANFDIYFMSAKHGLVHGDTVLQPYEQPMSKAQLKKLINNEALAEQAKLLINKFDKDAKIKVVLPLLYKELLSSFLNISSRTFTIEESTGGIGHQRGYLKRFIEDKLL